MIKLKKSIFILGLGVSGMSLAKNLKSNFEKILCWDDDISRRNEAQKKKINILEPSLEGLKNVSLLVLSPGINHQKKNPHIAVKYALKLKIKIISDIELIHTLSIKNKTIGITGTNGKTTTTKFISDTLNFKNFIDLKPCGNIGLPFTEVDIKKKQF